MLIGGVHVGARALLDIKCIWLGYIARLSQCGGEGVFYSFTGFLPAFAALRGRGVSTLWLLHSGTKIIIKFLILLDGLLLPGNEFTKRIN